MTTCLLHSISIINAEYHNEHGNVQQNQKQKKKKTIPILALLHQL